MQGNGLLGFTGLLALTAILVLAAVVPATLGMGLSVCLIVAALWRHSSQVGENVGGIHAADAFAAIAGAIFAGVALRRSP